MKKYKGTYFDMWDAWFLNDNDRIHAFHLKAHPGNDWNVGHIYTDDLLNFHKMRDVLETLPEEKYPQDCLGKFTGCAVKKDGKYYLYYTMRDKYASEKIGLAISEDGEHFPEYENNPVLTPDENIFVVRKRGEKTDCRDMNVVYDEERGIYFGYFAAMADIDGRGELGVIGVAESSDLINWTNQKIVYTPDFDGAVEVPNVFKLGGKWYMTMLTGTIYGAKGAISDSNLACFTVLASADKPDGEFKCGEDNIFIGGPSNSGYTCRCFDYKGGIYVMYIDRSEYGAALSLPKEVKMVDGVPRLCYTDILKKLRVGEVYGDFEFSKIPTAWDWRNVSAGEISQRGNVIKAKAHKNSFQGFKIDNVNVKAIETEFEISGDFREEGFVLLCDDGNHDFWGRYAQNEYYISLNRDENLFVLYGNAISPIYRRKFDFGKKNSWNIRIIAAEGQLEVYVDDVLFMQCGIKTGTSISGGVFAFSGCADFENLKIWEL